VEAHASKYISNYGNGIPPKYIPIGVVTLSTHLSHLVLNTPSAGVVPQSTPPSIFICLSIFSNF